MEQITKAHKNPLALAAIHLINNLERSKARDEATLATPILHMRLPKQGS